MQPPRFPGHRRQTLAVCVDRSRNALPRFQMPQGQDCHGCVLMPPPRSSPTISAFCTGSLRPLLSRLQWQVSKSLQRQELDYTRMYMHAIAVTFPSKMPCTSLVCGSLERDTLSWGPRRTTGHRVLTTRPSLRKLRLGNTMASTDTSQLATAPGWGCPREGS